MEQEKLEFIVRTVILGSIVIYVIIITFKNWKKEK